MATTYIIDLTGIGGASFGESALEAAGAGVQASRTSFEGEAASGQGSQDELADVAHQIWRCGEGVELAGALMFSEWSPQAQASIERLGSWIRASTGG